MPLKKWYERNQANVRLFKVVVGITLLNFNILLWEFRKSLGFFLFLLMATKDKISYECT